MSKRNQNIENWLRQAAAQDPEVSPDQVKQQAWGQLSNMLDKEESLPRPPRSSGSGWWAIILEVLILAASFMVMHRPADSVAVTERENNVPLLMREQEVISLHEKENAVSLFAEDTMADSGESHAAFSPFVTAPSPFSATDLPFIEGRPVFAILNNSNAGRNNNSKSTAETTASSSAYSKHPVLEKESAGQQQKGPPGVQAGSSIAAGTNNSETSLATGSKAAAGTGSKTSPNISDKISAGTNNSETSFSTGNKAAAGTGSKTSPNISDKISAGTNNSETSLPTSNKAFAGTGGKTVPNISNKISLGTSNKASADIGSKTVPDISNKVSSGNKASAYADNNAASPEAIQRLTTKQLFVPVKDSGVRNTPAPQTLRANRESRERYPYSLKIAALLPIADAYGVAASIEYTYQWRKNWQVRPYIGAEYLRGFNRVYNHTSFTVKEDTGSGLYKSDSIFTHFILNGLLYGKAGVEVVYTLSKMEITAGMEYRYLASAFGKDTSKTASWIVGSLPSRQQPVPFNKRKTAGVGNARLQLGINYNLSRRLQIGADYYLQLNRKSLDSSYRFPHPQMPDMHSFQVHIRYFLPNP